MYHELTLCHASGLQALLPVSPRYAMQSWPALFPFQDQLIPTRKFHPHLYGDNLIFLYHHLTITVCDLFHKPTASPPLASFPRGLSAGTSSSSKSYLEHSFAPRVYTPAVPIKWVRRC